MVLVVTGLRFTCLRNTLKIMHQHMSSTFQYGEQLLSVDWKGRMRLFKLEKESYLNLVGGNRLSHDYIHDHTSNSSSYFTTNNGQIMVRRPTLEEYVLLMPRGPAIAYPKDIWAIIGILDIGPGSRIMEAGSGSGALTLHLSRLVSESGKVISFEVAEKHLATAKRNITRWAESLQCRGCEWIHNIEFHQGDVKECSQIVTDPLDAVVLDLVDCRNVLQSVASVTKQNGIIAVYAPNISQIIQIVHHLSRTDIPLHCESVMEFTRRHWQVKPAHSKNKKCSSYLLPNRETNRGHVCEFVPIATDGCQINIESNVWTELGPLDSSTGLQEDDQSMTVDISLNITNRDTIEKECQSSQDPVDKIQSSLDPVREEPLESQHDHFKQPHNYITRKGFPNYIARPSHRQEPHTAFIVKLRRL